MSLSEIFSVSSLRNNQKGVWGGGGGGGGGRRGGERLTTSVSHAHVRKAPDVADTHDITKCCQYVLSLAGPSVSFFVRNIVAVVFLPLLCCESSNSLVRLSLCLPYIQKDFSVRTILFRGIACGHTEMSVWDGKQLGLKLTALTLESIVATLGTKRVPKRYQNGTINICKSRLEVHLANTF